MTREKWQLRQGILRYVYNNGKKYLFKNSETAIFLSYCEMYKDDWMGCIDYETGDLDQFGELFDDVPIGKPISIKTLLNESVLPIE